MVAAVGHFFKSESRTVSHSPFACDWQNRFCDSEHVIALLSRVTKVEIRTYESHVTLWNFTSPHVCVLCAMYVGWAQAIR